MSFSAYPEFPATAVKAGRVAAITQTSASAASVRLIRDGQSFDVQITGSVALRVGDLVAVMADGSLMRLGESLDEYWREGVDLATLRAWSDFRARVRDFFVARDFLEVDTPSLVANPGTEPTLRVFGTDLKRGSRQHRLYLPTSPELHLKKALVRGVDRVFEIRRCFRNDEVTSVHQPEFWMIEWYRSYANLDVIIDDSIALIQTFAPMVPVQICGMRELFARFVGIELTPAASLDDFRRWTKDLGFEAPLSWTIDDLFFWIFTEKIEAHFDPETVMIVRDWPPFQAALSRIGSSGWAERFEIYWRGMELANAFHELNDPDEQERRFQEDLRKKQQAGHDEVPPIDQEFLRALRSGMPPSAGIALGIERLFMAVHGLREISALRMFPLI